MFGEVFIPEAVFRELERPATPSAVATWLSRPPAWLHIEKISEFPLDERLEKLGEGEREAILLSVAKGPDVLLLIDEYKGRQEAARRQITFMGLVGVLDKAAAAGIVDLPVTIEKLLRTNFRVFPDLLQTILDLDANRKRQAP